MKPERVREFVKLIREHFRLQADVKALAAILETAVRLNQPPFEWLEALKLTRKEAAYRSISEQFEPQLAELERSLEENDLARLLKSIPPVQFPN